MGKKYVVFDLRDIARELGAHFNQVLESEHYAWCDCGERVGQTDATCPGCGLPVVWRNSRTWKELYGSPTAAVRRLRSIMPTDEAGKYLMRRAREPGFKSAVEAEEWAALTSVLSTHQLTEVVDYCAQKTRGRGLIKYVLNAAKKKAEKMPAADQETEWEVIG